MHRTRAVADCTAAADCTAVTDCTVVVDCTAVADCTVVASPRTGAGIEDVDVVRRGHRKTRTFLLTNADDFTCAWNTTFLSVALYSSGMDRARGGGESDTKARRRMQPDDALDLDLFLARAGEMSHEDLLRFLTFVLRATQEAGSLDNLDQSIRGAVLGSYFRDAPYLVLSQIALGLPIASVRPFCAINQSASAICESEYFWKRRVEQDFGLETLPKATATWRQAYTLASTNPPRGYVNFFRGDGNVETLRLQVSGGEFECEGCWLLALKWFTTQNLRGVASVNFYGDNGYPVVFERRDAPLPNGAEFVRADGFFVLVESDNDNHFSFIFQARVVQQFNVVSYGEVTYRQWLEQCEWADDASVLVYPQDLDPTLTQQQADARALELYVMLPQFTP